MISLFDEIRVLTDAELSILPGRPTRLAVAWHPLDDSASRATLQLVDSVLATDEDAGVFRDVLCQLDVAQRAIDRLPVDAPETTWLERILDALPLCGEPTAELAECLADYEAFLQREARLEEALDVLGLGVRAHGPVPPLEDFAERALRAGRLNRLLARWDRATAWYAAAIEAGQLLDNQTAVLRGRLGHGAVYRGQGEFTAARATAETVTREAGRLGFAEVQALACGELAVVLRLQGAVAEGLQAAYHAFQVSSGPGERMHALRDVGLGLAAAGAFEESRSALTTVATRARDVLLRMSAAIGLMGVEAAVGDRIAFERWRDEADDVRGRMPPGMAVAHRVRAGAGLARFGQPLRAHAMLDEALVIARANRFHGWCREIEARLEPMAMAG